MFPFNFSVDALLAMQQAVNMSPQDMQALEEARSVLFPASIFIIVAGAMGMASSWAVYYYGWALSLSAIIIGSLQVGRSSNVNSMVTQDCCLGVRGGFSTLHTFHIINTVGAGIGGVISVIAIVVWSNENYPTYRIFAIIALMGCII